MKAKEIINLAAYQASKLTGSALSEAYQTLKSVFNKRAEVFRKHGAERALPAGFRSDMPSSRGMTEAEKLQTLKSAAAFMRGERSSFSGWKRSEMEQMEELNERLDDAFHFNNLDEFRRYGEFMGEMQTRMGDMWKQVSNQVRELYFQSERLGLDSSMFMKNYEYWLAHGEALQRAEPLQYSGRGVKASDYARQLHLPKISTWYSEKGIERGVSKQLSRKKK